MSRAVRIRRHRTAIAVAVAAVAIAACTSSDDGSGGTASDDNAEQAAATTPTTSTTAAPLVRGLGEDLGLGPGQCYAMPPETTTTAPPTTPPPTTVVSDESAASDESETTTTTEATTTTEPPPITTTIPTPPLVAIVSCEGSHDGVVFATFCIGSLVGGEEVIDLPTELGAVECDGDPDLAWPGDRLLRRSAARECVARFDDVFGEPYALSEIGTTEFVPSRGVWERGDRRIVCTADQV